MVHYKASNEHKEIKRHELKVYISVKKNHYEINKDFSRFGRVFSVYYIESNAYICFDNPSDSLRAIQAIKDGEMEHYSNPCLHNMNEEEEEE